MRNRILMMASIFALAATHGIAGLLTDAEVEAARSAGATEEMIDAMNNVKPVRNPETAEDFLALGRSGQGSLKAAVSRDAASGLALAREIIWREKHRGLHWPDRAVIQAVGKHPSQATLGLLEDAVRMYGQDSRAENARREWVNVFILLHGETAIGLALTGLNDSGRSPVERALHMRVLRLVRKSDDSSQRAAAIEAYRPHLLSSDPALQRAALIVSQKLWDYEAFSTVRDVALSSTDLRNRKLAFTRASRFYQFGPDREAHRRSVDGLLRPEDSIPPYDLTGFRAWHIDVKPDWKRENYRLRHGVEPPPGWPHVEREKPKYRATDSSKKYEKSSASSGSDAKPTRLVPKAESPDP